MKTITPRYIDIDKAEYVADYKIRLRFNDGTVRIVDFEPFLRTAQHPDLTKYRALKKFKSFQLNHGNIMWGDYEMIFPVVDLYRGTI